MTLKKLFAGLFSLAAALLAVCAITVCAGAETSGDYEYSILDDGTVEITDYYGSATELEIPSTLDGKKVTSIGYGAFSYCKSLISIKILDSVTSIGDSAFECCESLTSIDIPDSVTSIGDSAFGACSNLSIINIPNGITSIESYTFSYCSNLSAITIPDSVTSIGYHAFYDTPFLDNQTTTVKYGGKWVIGCDTDAISTTIKNGTIGIAYGAFDSCSNLTSIIIPNDVTIINSSAFAGCSSLTSITIPDGVTKIESFTFSSCEALTTITIPDGVTSIESHAFERCSNLASVILPDSVTSIGNRAFSYCESLTSINIPDSVTYIDDGVFLGTPFLDNQTTTVKYAGKWVIGCVEDATAATINIGTVGIVDSAFYGCKSLTSVMIPDGVTSIGDKSFCFCSSLTTITIPDSLTSIGYEIFDFCDSLKDVYYTGSKAQWDKITISELNYELFNATIHFAKEDVPAPSSVTGLKLKGRAGDALRIAWTKNTSADGYIIEMKDGSKWTRVGKITKNSTVEFRKDKLKAGTAYTFRVKAYKMDGKTALYSGYTTISARTNPSAVSGLKLKGRAADALRIAWTKNTSADGYIIEMKSGNSWTRVGKITSNSTVEFRKAGLKAGSAYSFRVKAYKMSGKTALYSGYTTISVRTNPSAVSGLKLKASAKDAVRLSWTKNTSADGYIIEMKVGGVWKRAGKITKNSTVEFRKSGLKSKTSYTFRVQAYKMSGKTALYGATKTITVKTK